MNYPNDDKLILLCYRHYSKAFNILLKRYSEFIRAWSANFVVKYPRMDFDDLLITGLASFLNAYLKFNIYKGLFYMFMKKIIENDFIKKLIEYNNRNNFIVFSNSTENSDRFFYLKEDESDPFYACSKYDEVSSKFNNFNFLNKDMKEVIHHKLEGLSNKKIASIMNINEKKVDNIYMEAKRRIKQDFFNNKNKEN